MLDPIPNTSFDADRILQSVTDAVFVLDSNWHFTSMNDQAEKLLQCPRASLLGKSVWDEFPAAVGTAFETEYRRAVDTQAAVTFEEYYPPPLDTWFEVTAYPAPDGLSVYFHDINERRQVQDALRSSEEALRTTETHLHDAYALLSAALAAGGIATWNWNLITGRFVSDARLDRLFSVSTEDAASGRADPYIQAISEEDRPRVVRAIEDVISHGEVCDVEYRVAAPDGSVHWLVSRGRVERDAQGKAISLPGVVLDITDRKAMEAEQERLAAANRLLLDSTGEGIYGIDLQGRFTFINRAAERMLGALREQMLGRNAHTLIHHTWADGSPYPEDECPIYQAMRDGESVHVEDDLFWQVTGASFPVAYSAAPILEGGEVCGSVVTFTDISERKAIEQERERLVERERNIAQQLQAALTPAIPEHIPGMALAKYYEAALGEAGVGGDFYDVFPIDKGCTALVLGDLSGKGLAAASQVATVRNMLRYAIYQAQTLVGAVTSLNDLLAEQELLTGFATLFIGAFDSAARTLTYVNCGQEPALLRRTLGTVAYLYPTGPILGSLAEAAFEEGVVALEPGDILAVFSDGLTEVGPNRREMIGIEGVADLLMGAIIPAEADSAQAVSEHLTLQLIAGVDAAAARGGVMRDDVCLLVGVVE